jgi:hypothetical protein
MKTMQRAEILRLTEAGAEIEVKDGCVWVTQDRDPADYILSKGCTFRIGSAGGAVASALKSALVEIRFLGVVA